MADDDWDRILAAFKPPWKIRHPENGAYRIEDANNRPFIYVYPRNSQVSNYKLPTDEEALLIVKAIAKMSKRRSG